MLSLNAKRRIIIVLVFVFLATMLVIAYFETAGH